MLRGTGFRGAESRRALRIDELRRRDARFARHEPNPMGAEPRRELVVEVSACADGHLGVGTPACAYTLWGGMMKKKAPSMLAVVMLASGLGSATAFVSATAIPDDASLVNPATERRTAE